MAGRFSGPRRHRWVTGLTSLVTVWLAGVTGYWLVWDVRSQALTEALNQMFGGLGAGAGFLVSHVYGPQAGTGWTVLFAIWLVHLGLTAVIAFFVWRHVRRTRLRNLPPRHWMALMGVALIAVSIAVPAELLGPADFSRFVPDVPLDPFVLFLLPVLGSHPWLAVAVFGALIAGAWFVPRLVKRPAPVVVVDPEACTGCELCVPDCPYLALSMEGELAVVDPSRCVSCGICIGSCSFGALELPGFADPTSVDPAGKAVVLACSRHLRTLGGDPPAQWRRSPTPSSSRSRAPGPSTPRRSGCSTSAAPRRSRSSVAHRATAPTAPATPSSPSDSSAPVAPTCHRSGPIRPGPTGSPRRSCWARSNTLAPTRAPTTIAYPLGVVDSSPWAPWCSRRWSGSPPPPAPRSARTTPTPRSGSWWTTYPARRSSGTRTTPGWPDHP
ncbi:MAG: 4Fe-4S binding protein [Ilumatobacteraceae bacterium]